MCCVSVCAVKRREEEKFPLSTGFHTSNHHNCVGATMYYDCSYQCPYVPVTTSSYDNMI